MNGRVKNSNYSSLLEPSIDLTLHHNNFKTLKPDEASEHLSCLEAYMKHMVSLISDSRKTEFADCDELLTFTKEIIKTLELFIVKNRIAALAESDEPALSCSIDPSDSGFPIFIRDFRFLANDKERAGSEVKGIKSDDTLVENALYDIFKGTYPTSAILEKLKKNYFETLLTVEIADETIQYTSEKKESGKDYFIKEILCRLNGDDNLPQVYTLYFKVPSETYYKNKTWREKFDQAIKSGLTTVSDLELSYLAKQLGAILEIDLHLIERYTIGPFYSRFTEHDDGVETLFEDSQKEDGMLMFIRHSINKIGENKKRSGIFFKKKRVSNKYSPVIESPRYSLLPHRFIQKAHLETTGLPDNMKMFGITAKGDVVD